LNVGFAQPLAATDIGHGANNNILRVFFNLDPGAGGADQTDSGCQQEQSFHGVVPSTVGSMDSTLIPTGVPFNRAGHVFCVTACRPVALVVGHHHTVSAFGFGLIQGPVRTPQGAIEGIVGADVGHTNTDGDP